MGEGERTAKLLNYLRVLAVLFERRGDWIDGTKLAERATISNRTANAAARAWLDAGLPITRAHDLGTVIRWRLAKHWTPVGCTLGERDANEVMRLLTVAARSPAREDLLRRLFETEDGAHRGALERVAARTLRDTEAAALPAVLSALSDPPSTLEVRYFSTHLRILQTLIVSPQRLLAERAMQLLAIDHTTGATRRLRLDRVQGIRRAGNVPWRALDEREIRSHLDESFDGFVEEDRPAIDVAFRVADRTWAWVEGVFPATRYTAAKADASSDGWTRVELRTRGMKTLAAFLVGLGGEVIVETEELRQELVRLAEAAIRANP